MLDARLLLSLLAVGSLQARLCLSQLLPAPRQLLLPCPQVLALLLRLSMRRLQARLLLSLLAVGSLQARLCLSQLLPAPRQLLLPCPQVLALLLLRQHKLRRLRRVGAG